MLPVIFFISNGAAGGGSSRRTGFLFTTVVGFTDWTTKVHLNCYWCLYDHFQSAVFPPLHLNSSVWTRLLVSSFRLKTRLWRCLCCTHFYPCKFLTLWTKYPSSMLQLQCGSRYCYSCKNTFAWTLSTLETRHCLWSSIWLGSSATDEKCSLLETISCGFIMYQRSRLCRQTLVSLRRSRSFFDGKGGSICEFWGSTDRCTSGMTSLELKPFASMKSGWVGAQLGQAS